MLSVIGTQQLSDDSLPEARGPARQGSASPRIDPAPQPRFDLPAEDLAGGDSVRCRRVNADRRVDVARRGSKRSR